MWRRHRNKHCNVKQARRRLFTSIQSRTNVQQVKEIGTDQWLEEMLHVLYQQQAPLHFAQALQMKMSAAFLKDVKAEKADIKLLEMTTCVVTLWPQFSRVLRSVLCAYRFRVCIASDGFDLQETAPRRWEAQVEKTMDRLRFWSNLSQEQKDALFETYYPEEQLRAKPPLFPHHLLFVKTRTTPPAFIIGRMSPNNWPAWEKLLTALECGVCKGSVHECGGQLGRVCRLCGGSIDTCPGHRQRVDQ